MAKSNSDFQNYLPCDRFVLRNIDKFLPNKKYKDREHELIRIFQKNKGTRSALAGELVIKHNMKLIAKIAFRFVNRGLCLCELIQEGVIGLIRAAKKFDTYRGTLFSTFAVWWIREGIDRAVKNRGRVVRISVNALQKMTSIEKERQKAAHLGKPFDIAAVARKYKVSEQYVRDCKRHLRAHISIDAKVADREHSTVADTLSSDQSKQPEELSERNWDFEKVHTWVSMLPPKSADFIRKRYGLIDKQPRTRAEMAMLLRCSEERVNYLEQKILNRLKSLSSAGAINGSYTESPDLIRENAQADAAAERYAQERAWLEEQDRQSEMVFIDSSFMAVGQLN